jgi:hypothetical protein
LRLSAIKKLKHWKALPDKPVFCKLKKQSFDCRSEFDKFRSNPNLLAAVRDNLKNPVSESRAIGQPSQKPGFSDNLRFLTRLSEEIRFLLPVRSGIFDSDAPTLQDASLQFLWKIWLL